VRHPSRFRGGSSIDRVAGRVADRGVASIEVIALYPVLVLLGTFALQAGAAVWTVTLTTDAARTAARAASLDENPAAAAEGALPASLDVAAVRSFDVGVGGGVGQVGVGGGVGPGAPAHGVSVTVRVPRVSPLPQFTVTRQAVMP